MNLDQHSKLKQADARVNLTQGVLEAVGRRLLLKFGKAARAYFSLQDSLLLGKLDITCLEKELDITR
ncbi:hypothetical protein Tco_1433065 [Tanacetum coccineum]